MTAKSLALYSILAVALVAGVWGVYIYAQPSADEQRMTRLRQLEVPPPGAARYAFLMKEVPDVVSQVTCACCARKLNQCYAGACPVDCGPCNEQGKTAFSLYSHGRSVKDIQAYMAKHHPVHIGAMGS